MERRGTMKVFVSASGQDAVTRDELIRHLGLLSVEVWHAGRTLPGEDPEAAARVELAKADVALVLLSGSYLAADGPGRTELPRILDEKARRGLRVLPVLVSPSLWDLIDGLKGLQPLPRDGVPLSAHTAREAMLVDIAKAIGAPARTTHAAGGTDAPPEVSRRHLPTGGALLLGREAEIAQLDDAWASQGRIRVLSIVAMGGAGKSTLVIHWLNRLAADNYRGARRVFGYSFYRQGTNDAAADTDPFFAAAFRFFGLSESAMPPPPDRPDCLIALCRRERTLLVLDGLEPIQDHSGRIKAQALGIVLRELAAQSPGMVVLTSRVEVQDVAADEGSIARVLRLKKLPAPIAVALLRKLGVTRGDEEQLREAAADFKGHALALTLLGTLLARGYQGDIRRYKELPGILDKKTLADREASRSMAAYDRWLGGRERAILRLLGLFDRPAPGGALAALRKEPVVAGLNEGLVGLGDVAWREAISDLRAAGLVESEDAADPDAVDAHPLVREYFGTRLKGENEAAWVEGNRRLYVWYADVPKKERPDTAEEMEPLYVAVLHGCRAELHQQALDDIFFTRIRRGAEHYSIKRLGLFDADLRGLSSFFEHPWTHPVRSLLETDRSWVLANAGVALRAAGRLQDAMSAMSAALSGKKAEEDWEKAAVVASNLSDLQLALGDIEGAKANARESVTLANRADKPLLRAKRYSILAHALHQAGEIDDAKAEFSSAESWQLQENPSDGPLGGHWGYYYCDFLMSRGERDGVLQRAESAIHHERGEPVEAALNRLVLARAHFVRDPECQAARGLFDDAVARLIEAGREELLCLGLIHRGTFHRRTHDLSAANRDLDEALRIATRGHMRLHEADAYLERTRLLLAQQKPAEARAELDKARTMIDQMGYGRRKPEVEELAGLVGQGL